MKVQIGNESGKKEEKDKDSHGLTIQIGNAGEDSGLSKEVRAQLSPEQLYQLEMARLASKKEMGPLGEDILVPFGFFGMVVGIVFIVVWSRSRRARLLHDTMRIMAEKGQPFPEGVLLQNVPKPRSDLRRGFIFGAIGLGWIGHGLADGSSWGFGLIPLFIGIGYLCVWKLETPRKPDAGA